MQKSNLTTLRRKVLVLAHQLRRHQNLTFGEAQKMAWAKLKAEGGVLIVFNKVNRKTGKETLAKRIISRNWLNFYTPKGTGRPLKAGQILMVDLARVWTDCQYFLISTYQNRILEEVA